MAVQPAFGVWRWRRFLSRQHDSDARVRMYLRGTVLWCAWAALFGAGAVLVGMPLGLGAPRLDQVSATTSAIWAASLLVGLGVPLLWARRFAGAFGALAAMLPRTRRERGWFVVR